MTPLIVGLRFNPTEEELVSHYLKKRIIMGQSSTLWDAFIIERDLYGEKATPWELFKEEDDLPWHNVVDTTAKVASSEKVLYVFTKLSNFRGQNKHRVAGCGAWHANSGTFDVRDDNGKGRKIGSRRSLTFRSNEKTVGQWTMHEYSIDADANGILRRHRKDYVICKIKRDDSRSSKGGKLVSPKRNRVDPMHDDGMEEENHERQKKQKNSDCCAAGYRFRRDDNEIFCPTPVSVMANEQVSDQVLFGTSSDCCAAGYSFMRDDNEILCPTPISVMADEQANDEVLFGTIDGEIYCTLNHE